MGSKRRYLTISVEFLKNLDDAIILNHVKLLIFIIDPQTQPFYIVKLIKQIDIRLDFFKKNVVAYFISQHKPDFFIYSFFIK